MSKQQFLAELNQYLTFVSPEQRAEIITYFNKKLEQSGLEHESEVIAEIGTPMSVAISLKRRLESQEPLLPESEAKPTPRFVKFDQNETETPDPPKPESFPETEPPPEPELWAEELRESEPKAAEETETVVNEETVPVLSDDISDSEKNVPEEKAPTELYKEKLHPEAKKRVSFCRVLAAIGIAILSIIIVSFFICITALGVLVCASAVEIIISGVNAIGNLVNALMIFSAGAIILAIGLLITCFAVWSALSLIVTMIRKFKGTPSPEKSKLKTMWAIAIIIIAVLVSLGIISGAVSFFMGGDISIIHNDSSFGRLLSRLNPTNILEYLSNLVL